MANIALSIANVILGLLVAYEHFMYWRENKHVRWRWVKLGLALMGLYWAITYTVVAIARLGFIGPLDPVNFGRIFILPAITVSLTLCYVGAMMRRYYGN